MATNPIRPDFAPNVDDQWQNRCQTVGEAMSHFFLNDHCADVYFVPLRNASNPPRKFPGHKVVLAGRSPVLSAQFHYDRVNEMNNSGGEGESGSNDGEGSAPAPKKAKKQGNMNNNGIPEVELPDVEPEGFEQFLRFCYTDKVEITAANAASILDIASRFHVQRLEKLATDFICENISIGNAFDLLQFVNQFNYEGNERIKNKAWHFISRYTRDTVRSDAFFAIDRETLTMFASQDDLDLKEIELFQALIQWAKKRQTLPGNEGKSLRELLGSALFRVQFQELTSHDFGEIVVPEKVLTDAETIYVFRYFSRGNSAEFHNEECPFPYIGIQRGNKTLTLEITNAREIGSRKRINAEPESVFIRGFWFKLGFLLMHHSDSEKNICVFVKCDGCSGTIGEEGGWSCNVKAEITLVSKTPGKENKTRNFIALDELLRPENGWIDGESGAVTLKAHVKVMEDDFAPKMEPREDNDVVLMQFN